MVAKITRWVVFTVIFSLLPLAATYLEQVISTSSLPSPQPVIEHGELYLIAASLSAVGLGEIIGVNKRLYFLKIVFGGIATLNVFLCAALFTHVSPASNNTSSFLSKGSIWMFVFAAVIATSCIVLGDIKDA